MATDNDPSTSPDELTGLLSRTKTSGYTKSYRQDDPSQWTFSRRLALSRNAWYTFIWGANTTLERGVQSAVDTDNDDNEQDKRQMLYDAWGYFEHVTLPRHFVPDESSSATAAAKLNLQKAKPGEAALPTSLYSVWATNESDLADMGIGVGLYFLTLRALAWIFLLAGLCNIPLMLYYSSTSYNDDVEGGLDWILRGTAICTDQYWAPCPTCRWHDWDYFPRKFDRYAQTLFTDDVDKAQGNTHIDFEASLNFIRVNSCEFGYTVGLFGLISVVVVSLALYILSFVLLKQREVQFDQANQTSQDYSLRVENPPPDADNAEEWKQFFSQFGATNDNDNDNKKEEEQVVTCCTVVRDNEELVRVLVARRQLLLQLETLLQPGVLLDKHNLDHAIANALKEDHAPWWQKILFGTGTASDIVQKIRVMDIEIEALSQQPYQVSEIFITFETEQAQRRALQALSVSTLAPMMHTWGLSSILPENLKFRRKHLLRVSEAPEPTAVRWEDLDATLPQQLTQRVATSILTILCIIGSTVLISYTRYRHGATMAALVISIINTFVPYLCIYITQLELHTQADTKSTSRYIKITIFLFVNTAIVTSIITPFTDTTSNEPEAITHSLYAIYIFELFSGPLLQLLDPVGFLYRHVLGPRTPNFRRLLLLFRGTSYDLFERYTDMTNVILLTFYYGMIFPVGFLFAAATLCVHYWTDKWCLLRIWAQAPEEGTRISVLCRTFIMFSLMIYVVMSAYAISAFPYDNACEETNATLPIEFIGNHTIYDFDNHEYQVSITPDATIYRFCDQDLLRYRPFPVFPPLPSKQPKGSEWMDADQEVIANVFGWTGVAAIAFVLAVLVRRYIIPILLGLFQSTYQPTGKASLLGFSEIKEIFAYVPQVRIAEDSFPLLVCDVTTLDPELIGWHDPYLGTEAHNVLYDIPGLAEKPVFSTVHHWPPPARGTVKSS